MSDDSPLERARENVTEIVSILVTGIWMGALFTGQDWWLAALLIGYVVVVPITETLFGDEEETMEDAWEDDSVSTREESTMDDDQKDALETLRERYARGELTDEQFERKVERLLETETIEDVEDRARRNSGDRTSAGRDDREPETEFS